jgi:choline dehydrogenase-like flavoprotein
LSAQRRAEIMEGWRLGESVTLRADVVIVGTGAGGSMAAHDLAAAGLSVIALESGPHLPPAAMTQREDEMIPLLFAEAGGRATRDLGVTVLQGRGVGGSTLHNTNLCKRLPEPIRADWVRRFGLDALTGADLDADFAAIESMLNVHPVPDDRVNENNWVMQRGVDALGYRGGRLSHNRDGQCQRSGFCELGCAYGGKVNGYRACLLPALATGHLQVIAGARAEEVLVRRGRAVGVRGVWVTDHGARRAGGFEVTADAVIMAASATGSAALAARSRLPDPYAQAGAHLRMHPGCAVVGVMPHAVEGWRGNPQAVECTEFLDFADPARHVWLVSGFAHPAGSAAMMPGFGAPHAQMMRSYARCAGIIAMVHDDSSGYVRAGAGERVEIDYALNPTDRAQLALGMREAARILLAAGAQRVLIPLDGGLWVEDPSQLAAITAARVGVVNPALTAVHPMGTMRMSADPRRGVTRADGSHHHVAGLFVADGALLPSSIGGPPQLTIYTLGRRVARAVVASLGRA